MTRTAVLVPLAVTLALIYPPEVRVAKSAAPAKSSAVKSGTQEINRVRYYYELRGAGESLLKSGAMSWAEQVDKK